MYQHPFSIVNISKIMEGGLSEFHSKQTGGKQTRQRYKRIKQGGEGEEAAAAPAPAPAVVSSTPAVITSPKTIWDTVNEKIREVMILFFTNIIDDLNPYSDSWAIRPKLWSTLTISIIILLIIGLSISMYILIKLRYDTRKLSNIIEDSRRNKDYPEYEIVRSKRLSSYKYPFIILLIIPCIILLCIFIITFHKKLKGDNLIINGKMPSLPFIILLPIGLISLIALIITGVTYSKTNKQVKNIRNDITKFEKFVLNNCYINLELFNTLYHEGNPPNDVDSVVNNAIRKVFNNELSDKDKQQIVYTLLIYIYLQKTLTNSTNDSNRNYLTASMTLFNPSLSLLPSKSRIFKIAHYMYTNAKISIQNDNEFDKIIDYIKHNGYVIDDTNKLKDAVNKLLLETENKAFALNINHTPKMIHHLSKTIYIAYWILIIIVALILLIKKIRYILSRTMNE